MLPCCLSCLRQQIQEWLFYLMGLPSHRSPELCMHFSAHIPEAYVAPQLVVLDLGRTWSRERDWPQKYENSSPIFMWSISFVLHLHFHWRACVKFTRNSPSVNFLNYSSKLWVFYFPLKPNNFISLVSTKNAHLFSCVFSSTGLMKSAQTSLTKPKTGFEFGAT